MAEPTWTREGDERVWRGGAFVFSVSPSRGDGLRGVDMLIAAANDAESARVESERLRERIRIADHIITRIGRRPAANGDYRGYAWAQAEAELSALIDQYNALAGAALSGEAPPEVMG